MRFKRMLKLATVCEVCHQPATRVMLLNTPDDFDYIVGTCDNDIEKQADGSDWPTIPMPVFKTAWDKVINDCRTQQEMRHALSLELEAQ